MPTNRSILAAAAAALAACAAGCSKPAAEHHNRRTSPDERRDVVEILEREATASATLRLLETTDLHVNMESFDYYRNAAVTDAGLVRTATLIRRARAEQPNALLVDNGDLIQGSPLGDWFQKERDPKTDLHPVFKAMNLLGYDVANVGNHEFNYGLDFLEAALQGAKFPYVNANVFKGDANWIQPYVILERMLVADDGTSHAVKIGVMGFVPPQIMNWDRSNLLGKVEARDIVDAATALVPRLRAEGADVIVAVPHSGINPAPRKGMDENAAYYLTQIDGIDAVLTGHSHQVFPSPTYARIPNTDLDAGTINGVPVVMAGQWGSHLGVVDLKLKLAGGRWHVAGGKSEAREVKTALQPDEHEADVRAVVAEDHGATLRFLEQEVGEATQPIHSYFSLLQPSSAVQLVQEAQLWYVRKVLDASAATDPQAAALRALPLLSASAPLKAGGKPDNYTDVPAGKLTLRNVADLYVYPNTVKVVKVTGAQLADWLEMAAGAFARIDPAATGEQQLVNASFPAYNFDQILGVRYEIDVTQPARFDRAGQLVDERAHRIVGLTYEGAPVTPTQEFLVVTNNYRANGGGAFPGLDGTNTVLDPGRESREALRDYVAEVGTVGGRVEASWRLKPVAGLRGALIYRSSPRAREHLAELGGLLEAAGEDADGFARYRMRWVEEGRDDEREGDVEERRL